MAGYFPVLIAGCICSVVQMGCSLIFPPRIDTYALHPDLAAESSADSFNGMIWLREFDISDEFNTNKFMSRDPISHQLTASKNYEWAGMASDVAGDLAFRCLSQRFAGHVQISITPPADFVIEGRVEDMSINNNGTESPYSVSFELYYQIEEKTGQSYVSRVAMRDTAVVQVPEHRGEHVANAMAQAIQTVTRRMGDTLVSVARARHRAN
jgi:hypothetical protein